jgi:hypothetical protein
VWGIMKLMIRCSGIPENGPLPPFYEPFRSPYGDGAVLTLATARVVRADRRSMDVTASIDEVEQMAYDALQPPTLEGPGVSNRAP